MADPSSNADHAGFDPPLRIDWIEGDLLEAGVRGRLGLTFLPGKHGVSTRYPGRTYQRDLDEDLRSLVKAGVRRLILLVDDEELAHWSDPRIVERGVQLGVDVRRHPIPDGRPPAHPAAMRRILDDIREARGGGDVAIACMGGVGRTGTVAACALVDAGMSAEQAIAMVRSVRHPQAVETEAQEAFVHAFAASLAR